MSPEFDYDVFVSYRWTDPDMTWVRQQLVPALRNAGLRVCLDVDDFVPGRNLVLEMDRAETRSRSELAILSPSYFDGDDRQVRYEALKGRLSDPSGSRSHLIPFLFRETDLPGWIRGYVPVDWTVAERRTAEWQKLLTLLGATDVTSASPDSMPTSAGAPTNVPGRPIRRRRLWPAGSLSRVNHETARREFRHALFWLLPAAMGVVAALLAGEIAALRSIAPLALAARTKMAMSLVLVTVSAFFYGLILTRQANLQIVLSVAQSFAWLGVLYFAAALMPFVPQNAYAVHDIAVIGVAALGLRYVAGMFVHYSGRREYGDAACEALVIANYLALAWGSLSDILHSWKAS